MIIDPPLLGPRDAAEFVYLGDASLIERPDWQAEDAAIRDRIGQMRDSIGQPVDSVKQRKGKAQRGRRGASQRNVADGEGGTRRATGRIPKPKRGV